MAIEKTGYINFIANPKSGASSSSKIVKRLRNFMVENGYRVRIDLTRSLSDAQELAHKAACSYDCSLVVGCGGDGTIREIIQGLEGSDKPLMIVPSGTENLLANELGYTEKVEDYINTFKAGVVKPLDVGQANGRCFTSILGVGFDADVVQRFSDLREGHISHLDYFWPIWRTYWLHKFPRIKVEIEGEEVFNDYGMVFVGNISRYAVGLEILKKADYGDGLLDVCIYRCGSKTKLAKHSAMTVLKCHSTSRDVIYRQCDSLRISSDEIVRTEIDGDPGPALPLDIKMIANAIRVVVPENAKPAGVRTRLRRALGI